MSGGGADVARATSGPAAAIRPISPGFFAPGLRPPSMTDPTPALVGAGAVLVLVAVSAFFSSSETAIFSLPTGWIDDRAASGDPGVATLRRLREDPHRLLVTLLVGNNVVNVAISSITTAVLVGYLPTGPAVTLATVIASSVVLVFGEIVPKSYGLGNARLWATRVAGPIAVLERLLYPLVLVFDVLTRSLAARIGGDREIEEQFLPDQG